VSAIVYQLLDGSDADISNPRPEWFEVRALAHSLSGKFRWCGQSRERITVAEHSVRVSRMFADPLIAFYALLHELDEHLLPDCPSPLKRAPEMVWYRSLCEKHIEIGSRWHGLEYPWPAAVADAVHAADLIMLATETRDLTANVAAWLKRVEPLPDRIVPMSPDVAEQEFLGRYSHLNSLRSVA
jgi:hypothetical protein